MKRTVLSAGLLALVSGLIGPGAWAGTSQPLPTPFPEGRYQQMSTRSPFAVSTAAAATAAATPGFAALLYVDGVAHIGESDFVAIKSRDPDKTAVIFLEVGESTEDGMKVEQVKWSDQMGKSTVVVSKGNERATLIFDEAQMAMNPGVNQQLAPGRGFVRLPARPWVSPPANGAFQQPGAQFGGNRMNPSSPPGQQNGAQSAAYQAMVSGGGPGTFIPASQTSPASQTGQSAPAASTNPPGLPGNGALQQAANLVPRSFENHTGTPPQANLLQWRQRMSAQ
jgi:hypothetical protein